MRLLLIRHGQTPSNITMALDTAFPGPGLTALGHRQAHSLPSVVATREEFHEVAGVYASPLVRTQLTAAPLATSLGLRTMVQDGLEEIAAGELEMATDKRSITTYIETLGAWIGGDLDRRMPGGGDGHEFRGRYDGALTRIAAEHDDDQLVAAFSHGAAIRTFAALATSLEPAAAADLHIANTGAGLFEGRPETGWRLRQWWGDPIGGAHLRDDDAHDIVGESLEDAVEEAHEEG